MVLFLRKVCFFGLLLTTVLGGIHWLSETKAPVYPESKKRIDVLREVAAEVKAVALRNSHNQGINYEVMGIDGFHLWIPGGDLFEAEYILRNVKHLLTSMEYVLIPFPLHVTDNSTISGRSGIRRKVYKRYSFGVNYLPGDSKLYLKAQLSSVIRPDNWQGVLWPFSSAEVDSVAKNGRIYALPTTGHPSASEIDAIARERAHSHISIQKQSLSERPSLCDDALDAVSNMAATAGTKATLVLYKPPYPEAYERTIENETPCSNLKKRALLLAQEHPAVEYIDLSSVLPDENTHVYFLDGDHLNARGARIMSSALGDSLRNLAISR